MSSVRFVGPKQKSVNQKYLTMELLHLLFDYSRKSSAYYILTKKLKSQSAGHLMCMSYKKDKCVKSCSYVELLASGTSPSPVLVAGRSYLKFTCLTFAKLGHCVFDNSFSAEVLHSSFAFFFQT